MSTPFHSSSNIDSSNSPQQQPFRPNGLLTSSSATTSFSSAFDLSTFTTTSNSTNSHDHHGDLQSATFMEPPLGNLIPYENPSLAANHHHHQQQQQHQQIFNRDVLLMNRKLAQLALLDSNGNDNNGGLDIAFGGGGGGGDSEPFVAFNSNNSNHLHNNHNSHLQIENVQPPPPPPPPFLGPLRRKLDALKAAQATLQGNFLQSSAQYGQFALQLRHQLNAILQEVNDDLEGMFKGRMLEMAGQQATIEEAISRLESHHHQQRKSGLMNGSSLKNGLGSGEEDHGELLAPLDVDIIRHLLEVAVPGSGIRVPAADPVLSDRQLRTLVLGLLKGGGSGGSGNQVVNGSSEGDQQQQQQHQQQQPLLPNGLFGEQQQQHSGSSSNNNLVPPAVWSTLEQGVSSNNEPNNSKLGSSNHHQQHRPTPTYSAIAEQGNFRNSSSEQPSNSNNNFGVHPSTLHNSHPQQNSSSTTTNSSSTSLSHHYQPPPPPINPNHNSAEPNNSNNSSTGRRNRHSGESSSNNGGGNTGAAENSVQNQKSLQPKLRRDRMSYVLKFGEQGAAYGQFAEPSGVAVSLATEDIYIADANNHRIQVFDKWGKFKYHFGEGRLKFPNRVALSAISGEVVVSERPPVHQIQVYDASGAFLVKFGSKHLRHPRGLTVDHHNRVVVVECKVMRVFVFSLRGDLLHSFDCASSIQFPNAVAVSRSEEIYISDNRSHCVKVFNFAGECLRVLGGAGITNYPIGVLLDERSGTLAVVDNYNNLNVTLFRAADGAVLAAFESSVKHQQCLDVAPFGADGSTIVVTSKDLQVYIYRIKAEVGGVGCGLVAQQQLSQQQQQQQQSRRSFGSSQASSSAGSVNQQQQQQFQQLSIGASLNGNSSSSSSSQPNHHHHLPPHHNITNSQLQQLHHLQEQQQQQQSSGLPPPLSSAGHQLSTNQLNKQQQQQQQQQQQHNHPLHQHYLGSF